MPVMKPMGDSARLWVEKRLMPNGPPLYEVMHDDGNGTRKGICASDDEAALNWLVGSAAAFHRIPFAAPVVGAS